MKDTSKRTCFDKALMLCVKRKDDVYLKALALQMLDRISIDHLDRVKINHDMCTHSLPSLNDDCFVNIYGDNAVIMDFRSDFSRYKAYKGNIIRYIFSGTRYECQQYIKQRCRDMHKVRFTYPGIIDDGKVVFCFDGVYDNDYLELKLSSSLNVKDGETYDDFIVDTYRNEVIHIIR